MCGFSDDYHLSQGFAWSLQPSSGQSRKAHEAEMAEIQRSHSLLHPGSAQKSCIRKQDFFLSSTMSHHPDLAWHRGGWSLHTASRWQRWGERPSRTARSRELRQSHGSGGKGIRVSSKAMCQNPPRGITFPSRSGWNRGLTASSTGEF